MIAVFDDLIPRTVILHKQGTDMYTKNVHSSANTGEKIIENYV